LRPIFFGTNEQTNGTLVVDWARCHFFDRMHLWFHKSEGESVAPPTTENSKILSEAFYEEIDRHRVPVEREVVAALANAPGVLDLYLWLVGNTWSLNGSALRIPLSSTGGLADQLGTRKSCADRFFRHKLSYWLSEIKTLWAECPSEISQKGQTLALSSSKCTPAVSCGNRSGPVRFSAGLLSSTKPFQPLHR